jgi:CheY-like chemotaxis protein
MENKNTILIVDDHLVGRETLKGLLFGRGYNLLFAENGLEALEKAEKFTPDLILLDVMMPGMDGFEVCERLRANPLVAEVPVIMVTALDDRDSRLRGIEAGADDFVSKPFDSAELRKRVQTITRLNRYRRLLSERTKFEWVVEQADDGYIIINDEGQIIYANSQGRLYLNLSEDIGEGSNVTFLSQAQQQYNCEPGAAWSVWPHKAAAGLPRYLVQPATSSASAFWLQVDTFDMNVSNTGEYLVRLRDISPKVADQRSMWTFHGQISHKLRTPLNHLFASMDMISDEDLSGLDPDVKTFFSIAKQGAIRLKNELQGILQYIDMPHFAGSGVEGCPLIEIPGIIDNINGFLKLDSVTYSFDGVDSPDQTLVMLSKEGLEMIFWEILENSQKFHPTQSPTVHINITKSAQGEIVLEVSDNGVNLSPAQLEKMWTPYYQVEKYFTGQIHGSGLGLSIVTSLIWGVGGTCTSHNVVGKPGIVVELKMPQITNDAN